ncbi:ABC transporter permease [Nonomuraea spiralis]|uniref:ABC transporter permease n=1 Tax=Nonomuraea spiralis TaxID=46182 RepID=A0ABV5IWI0_9ACTN|nr:MULTISPECIES: ABC transporter permease [Nonomuraea]RSM96512.1 ABC transporter permease [Nonomuraea sp. WAC 01424]GGT31096.1 ABC transporter permease [Nonomuraea spiralis]
MGWAGFLLRRSAGTAAVVLLLSAGVFGLLYLAPGDIQQTLLGTRPATASTIAALRARYHLDDPVAVQYLRWLGGVLRGDLGVSIRTGQPVGAMLGERLPRTLVLTAYGTLLAALAGLPLGVLGALRKGRASDRLVVTAGVVGLSAPPFAVGLLLLVVFALGLGWFPVYGTGEGFAGELWHLTLPAVALAAGAAGMLLRFSRAALVRELDQDYVVFARARGLSAPVVLGYAMRNSLVPVLTAAGLVVTGMLAGTVLVEVTFALPGLGSLLVDSVTFKDVPVVQALALLLTLLIAAVNLLVDVAYSVADPRVRLGGGAS